MAGNKEAHREIADREEILRQIADNINGGVLTLVNDAGFCIRYANDGFLKLIGYTREELENVPSFLRAHLIYEEDAPKFRHYWMVSGILMIRSIWRCACCIKTGIIYLF